MNAIGSVCLCSRIIWFHSKYKDIKFILDFYEEKYRTRVYTLVWSYTSHTMTTKSTHINLDLQRYIYFKKIVSNFLKTYSNIRKQQHWLAIFRQQAYVQCKGDTFSIQTNLYVILLRNLQLNCFFFHEFLFVVHQASNSTKQYNVCFFFGFII